MRTKIIKHNTNANTEAIQETSVKKPKASLYSSLIWSSGFLRRGSDGMELASTHTPGPCSEYWRLQIGAENSSFCGAKGRL